RTVYASGKKGADRDIRKHLKLYCVFHQPGSFFYCLFKAVFMGKALKLPVFPLLQSSLLPEETAATFYLQYIPKNSFSVRFRRSQSKNFAKALSICYSLHSRILEQTFHL